MGGFSYVDGNIAFYSQINAILRPSDRVLDFGAGRGEHILDDTVEYRRSLSNLKGKCVHVEGCDVDDAVIGNPFLDHAEVIATDEPLPYANDSFDIIIARFVFEHVRDPSRVARELLRVLKPGGVIAALTPNKLGYIAIGGAIIPNALHVRMLRYIQPSRKSIDVFPTLYRLNTERALRKSFGASCQIATVYFASEPSYYMGSPLFFRATKLFHKYLPDRLRPLLIIFVQKSKSDF